MLHVLSRSAMSNSLATPWTIAQQAPPAMEFSLAAAAAKSLQLCPTLRDPIDGTPPGSSVPGILQARTLEWVAISFFNACMHAKSLQSCLTLCNPMDSSPPGSSVHRILQARIPEGLPFLPPGDLPDPGRSHIYCVSCVGTWVLYH